MMSAFNSWKLLIAVWKACFYACNLSWSSICSYECYCTENWLKLIQISDLCLLFGSDDESRYLQYTCMYLSINPQRILHICFVCIKSLLYMSFLIFTENITF